MFTTRDKIIIVLGLVIAALVYFRSSYANSYFVPYQQIEHEQAVTNQINQQSLWGDYPGGRNSSLSSYSQNYTEMNNDNNNYSSQQQAVQFPDNYGRY